MLNFPDRKGPFRITICPGSVLGGNQHRPAKSPRIDFLPKRHRAFASIDAPRPYGDDVGISSAKVFLSDDENRDDIVEEP